MFLILLLGPPGSGKGSLAQRLVQKYGFKHFSTGKIFRSLKSKVASQGTLVSDDDVNKLVDKELGDIFKNDPGAKVILDGFPRTIVQAEFIKDLFPINKVFYLTNLSKEFILDRLANRLLCEKEDHAFNLVYHPPKVEGICDFDGSKLYRRNDDTGEIIQKRLDVYRESTQPLIDYYTSKGLLIELDASKDVDELLKDCCSYMPEFL